MDTPLILIVEDDKNISRATASLLELKGYHVCTAQTLAEGKAAVDSLAPDLIVLDILLPDGNGLDYCRTLRSNDSGVRILFLSALNTKEDIINGLRAGGDDYLAKPYLTEELLLRIEALLRRGRIVPKQADSIRTLTWNRTSRQVFYQNRNLCLTPREYAVLDYLCREAGHYCTTEEIYREVWNEESLSDLSPVHNHIYSLRRKLESTGVVIDHSRAQGYCVCQER